MRTQYAEFLHFAGHHTTSILLHNNLNVTLRYTKYYRLQVKQTYINQYQNLESHKLIAMIAQQNTAIPTLTLWLTLLVPL